MLSKKRNFLPVLLAFAVAAWFPQYALANAGTPLMWAAAFHLVIGNTIIGVGEGLLVGSLFGRPKARCVGIMILANYFSAWIGMVILGAASNIIPMDITNGWLWYWILIVATYCVTLILEWPFAAWCFRGSPEWLKRSIRATVVVQAISYAVVFGLYWQVSKATLFTETKVVAAEDIPLPEEVVVYYIAKEDGAVYKRRLEVPFTAQKVFSPKTLQKLDDLCLSEVKKKTELQASIGFQTNDVQYITILDDFQGHPGKSTEPGAYWFRGREMGVAPKLGIASESPWEFIAGFYGMEGLRAENKKTGEDVRWAYETTIKTWNFRYPHHLPGDKVLFQLGPDQICVFDPVTRKIALLWRGRSPLAVMEK